MNINECIKYEDYINYNYLFFLTIFRLIYDPATGKPRGFGFCEYKDPQTANSAVRNLAGREVNGRPLRIDSATNAPGGEGSKGPSPPIGGGQLEVKLQ